MDPERLCERLAGAERERCLLEARRMPDRRAEGPDSRGSCEALIGPEKELCLKRGGTVETGATGATSGAGGTAAKPAK